MMLFARVAELVNEGSHRAVRIARPPDPSLVSSHVGDVHRILVASPEYLARRGKPKRLADLKPHSIIAHAALMPKTEWRYIDAGKPARTIVVPRIEINGAHAGIQLAGQGRGTTNVLSYMVRDALAELGSKPGTVAVRQQNRI